MKVPCSRKRQDRPTHCRQALADGHLVTALRGTVEFEWQMGLRVVRGDISRDDSVEAAVTGQDVVLSALGVRLPVRTVVLIILACQIVNRFVALPGPAAPFVEIGVSILAILMLFRRSNVLSEGTRTIVKAMEKQGVRRFICESSLGVGDRWRRPAP
jgi:hypothetical protein